MEKKKYNHPEIKVKEFKPTLLDAISQEEDGETEDPNSSKQGFFNIVE